jgi:biofilm PGA synthesis N-glycosyltransferase PgaC
VREDTGATSGPPRVLLVSPVHNEAAHLPAVAESVAAQMRQPDAWVVVDDCSSDGTLDILRELEGRIDFLRVLRAPANPPLRGRDRLAAALEARAFNWALERSAWREYDYIGKLDGDIELPPDYLERVLARFAEEPQLGIAGGNLEERQGGRWVPVRIPDYHVHGGLKLYRRPCFEAIGGIEERLGWDTIDETYARMGGYSTHSLPGLVARHHRPSASADGTLRGRARHGTCAYILRYQPLWVALRSLKVAASRPIGLSGAAFLYGYLSAALRRAPRVEDRNFERFVRRELRARLLRSVRAPG